MGATHRSWAIVLAVALGLSSVVPRRVLADSPTVDLDALRRRFTRALGMEEKGDYAGARAEFASIAEVKLTAQVQFHIALCDEQLGKLASALEGFERAYELAERDRAASGDVLENAPVRIASLRDRTPRLVLVVEEDGVAELSLDGAPLQTVDTRLEVRLDPGKHSVSVKREGQPPFTRDFSAEEASTTEFTIPRTKSTAAATVVAPPAPREETVIEPGQPIPGIVVGATGLALLVGGGVFLGLRQSTLATLREACPTGQGCASEFEDDAARGRVFNGLTWGLGAAGLAAVGAGVALYFTLGQDKPVTRAVNARVSVGPRGLFLSGSFD
jgi:hypothetical protein